MGRVLRQADRAYRSRHRLQGLPLRRRAGNFVNMSVMVKDQQAERIFPGITKSNICLLAAALLAILCAFNFCSGDRERSPQARSESHRRQQVT